MSIASEITRISGNIADAYTACNDKGATMPATENSDNLATTIASISAGGGGGGDAWSGVKSEIDGYTKGFTYSEKGYQYHSADTCSAYNIHYLEFDESAPDIYYFTVSGLQALKFPDTATIDTQTYSGKVKVTFSGDKYVYVASNNDYSTLFNYILLSNSSSVNCDAMRFIKHIASKYIYDSQYTSDNKYTVGYPNGNLFNGQYETPFLSHIYMSNYNFIFNTSPSDTSAIPYFLFSDKMSNEEKCAVYSSVTEGVTSFSKSYSNSVFSYNSYFMNVKSCPIVFDCSTDTSSKTVDLQSGGISSKPTYFGSRIKDLYIIPSASWNLNWLPYAGNSTDYAIIPLKCLKFLSDNAPNVSGKTISIGQIMINAADEADATIISTLRSKGWAVN